MIYYLCKKHRGNLHTTITRPNGKKTAKQFFPRELLTAHEYNQISSQTVQDHYFIKVDVKAGEMLRSFGARFLK